MKNWTIKINLSVSENWIADGFDAKERIGQIEELLTNLLPYATENELKIKATIQAAPDKEDILRLQGYKD
jgi:hypothetical protein